MALVHRMKGLAEDGQGLFHLRMSARPHPRRLAWDTAGRTERGLASGVWPDPRAGTCTVV